MSNQERFPYVSLAIVSFVFGLLTMFILPTTIGKGALDSFGLFYGLLLIQELALVGLPAWLLCQRSEQSRSALRSWWPAPEMDALGLTSLAAVSYSLAAIILVSLWLSLLSGLGIEPKLEPGLINPVRWWEYLFAFLVAALIPAFCEELMFRGLVWDALQRRLGDRLAILLSSLMFALLHLSIQGFAALLAIGLFLGGLRKRSGGLWLPVLFHALYNGTVILLNGLQARPSPQMIWFCGGIFAACSYMLFRREPEAE